MLSSVPETREQLEDRLNRNNLPEQAFDVIMELTLEEKKKLLRMWREYHDKKTNENANCNLAC